MSNQGVEKTTNSRGNKRVKLARTREKIVQWLEIREKSESREKRQLQNGLRFIDRLFHFHGPTIYLLSSFFFFFHFPLPFVFFIFHVKFERETHFHSRVSEIECLGNRLGVKKGTNNYKNFRPTN